MHGCYGRDRYWVDAKKMRKRERKKIDGNHGEKIVIKWMDTTLLVSQISRRKRIR